MNWEKFGFGCMVLYLAIALPLHGLNTQRYLKCIPACKEEGFDIVVKERITVNAVGETQCVCVASQTKEERAVPLTLEVEE